MHSLRARLMLFAALFSSAFGVSVSLIALSGLHRDLAASLDAALRSEWIFLEPILPELLARESSAEVTMEGSISTMIVFDASGSVIRRPSSGSLSEISGPSGIPPPEEFLTNDLVGLTFILSKTESRSDPAAVALLCSGRLYADAYAKVRFRLLLLTFGGVASSILIASLMGGRYSSRLHQIQEGARRLAHPDAGPSAIEEGQDEFDVLANILEDGRRKIAHDKLEIERLQRVRSQFLANVSHEVRTPLFALKGFLETLQDGGIDDPKVNRTFVESAYKQAQRLDALLRDLIEISRIESGEMRLSFRFFQLLPFLRQLAEDYAEVASQRKQTLRLHAPEGDVEVLGDKERLRQALDNLVDNALKYTPEGSEIVIGAVVKQDQVVIRISDNGPGIAAEHLPRIFERFYRVDVGRSREVGGTGLGLAIVKHLVEAHGSKMQVESVIGRGTSFSFELPT